MLLLFFFLASSESLLRRFVEIFPHFDEKRRAVSIVTQIEDNISQYLLTISMMNALVGLLNGVVVWLLGCPTPCYSEHSHSYSITSQSLVPLRAS